MQTGGSKRREAAPQASGFLRVEMLPGLHGDSLLIEYGAAGRARRLLIDGGPIGAFGALRARIDRLPMGDRRCELMVLSLVDADHVEGLIRLFAAPRPWWFVVKDVRFNGWRHLERAHGLLGARQGEFFSALLARRLDEACWNGAFGCDVVVVPDDQPLSEKTLADGLKLTILSPLPDKLVAMRAAWRESVGDAIDPGDLEVAWTMLAQQKKYLPGRGLLGSSPEPDALIEKQSAPDRAAANGSSIAFLAEYCARGTAGGGEAVSVAEKSCLFLADAHPDAICSSLRRLLRTRGRERLRVDAAKVAHHGSRHKTTDELLELIESPRYLFSTNGAQFGHPDEEAAGRVIARARATPPTLYFNYLSDQNRRWQSEDLQQRLGFNALFNQDSRSPMVVDL